MIQKAETYIIIWKDVKISMNTKEQLLPLLREHWGGENMEENTGQERTFPQEKDTAFGF